MTHSVTIPRDELEIILRDWARAHEGLNVKSVTFYSDLKNERDPSSRDLVSVTLRGEKIPPSPKPSQNIIDHEKGRTEG